MKKIKTVFLTIGLLSLAACSEQPEEMQAQMAEEARQQAATNRPRTNGMVKSKATTWGPRDLYYDAGSKQ